MSRDLSAAFVTAIQAGTVRPVLFYEGEFSTGFLRLTSSAKDISWDGKTWVAAGLLLGIAPVEEASDIRAVSFTVSLTGDYAANLSIALGAVRQGLEGSVWLGVIDSAGSLIADPFKAFSGRLDVPDVLDEGAQCRIAVRYESRLIDLERPRERRYTHQDQQIDYGGDIGFVYVASLQDRKLMWGRG